MVLVIRTPLAAVRCPVGMLPTVTFMFAAAELRATRSRTSVRSRAVELPVDARGTL